VITVALGCASFHFSTLEEYYTGGLFLGKFNAISDGSFVYISFNICMAIIGNNFWKYPVFNVGQTNEILFVDLLLYFALICTPGIISLCFKGILDHQKK